MASQVLLEAPPVSLDREPADLQARRGRPEETVILLATGLAVLVWLVSGAFRWQGYPADHAWGIPVAAAVGAAALTVFAAIGRLAIQPLSDGFRPIGIALIGWIFCRLTLASLFPLVSDEAYHWMWAKHLDLGYFDHPGMVAWMGRLFAPFHGQAAVVARLSPIVMSAGIVLLVYRLARITTGSRHVAARSALVLMLIPMFSLGFMLLIPSVAVNLFWLAALIFICRAVRHNRLTDWVLAGLACGGALNSNFTAFLLPPCVLAYLLATPQTRRLLLGPGPYAALLMTIVGFAPTLIWNARHGWITLVWNMYLRHDPTRFRPDGLSAYIAGAFFFVSPVLLMLMVVIGAKMARRGWRPKDQGMIFLAIMGFGPLAAWLAVSGIKFIVAYYAAPAIAPLLILCIHGCLDESGSWATPRLARWARLTLGLACVETMIVFAILLLPVFVPADVAARFAQLVLPRTYQTRVGEIYAWSAFGRYLESLDTKIGAQTPIVVMGPTYAQSSMVMYYARNVEMAYSLDAGTGRYGQQFMFWAPLESMPVGCDAIVFRPGRPSNPESHRRMLLRFFSRVEEQKVESDARLNYFTILRAYNHKGGMTPAALSRR